ncbi:hypothetical protein NPIL_473171 [Nephila pilipes]|uniref:Uncharacterized protein n=1 Tax=Nephila pilipes TaxID=299642 RepID=A0A8X6PRH7_NEPPI|nr:hypothetical protein NPIL_473171 [Nephila pilipes]
MVLPTPSFPADPHIIFEESIFGNRPRELDSLIELMGYEGSPMWIVLATGGSVELAAGERNSCDVNRPRLW